MAGLQHLADTDAAIAWLRERGVRDLATDSRRVGAGDAFIAWPGYAQDGRAYVGQAFAAGAAACLVEAEGAEDWPLDDPRIAALAGLKAHTGVLADAWYAHPSAALDVLAVTGTNGKTSTTWWLAQALAALGRPAGVVGTLGVGVPPQLQATGLTTPDPVTLHRGFRSFLDQGLKAAAIEASSIGVVESRLSGTRLKIALFTNFTLDHLDYHGSMAAYWAAKESLFDWPELRAAVINFDDEAGQALAAHLVGRPGFHLVSYGIETPARLQGRAPRYDAHGLVLEVSEGASHAVVHTTLLGDFNAQNLLAVIGGLRALGVPLDQAAAACGALTPVPGRMQRVAAGSGQGPLGVVDYAHTPDALDKALQALRPLAQSRGGRLWCVFGCGGNRDAVKRPQMAEIACRRADHVLITSDNPRFEDPLRILEDVRAGVPHGVAAAVEADRAAAIRRAVEAAGPADVILLAGKGHEDYQDIAGVKHPFSDPDQLLAALNQKGGA